MSILSLLTRREAFEAADVRRILRPGGVFVTQQVGSGEMASARALCDLPTSPGGWDRDEAVRQIEAGGLTVIDSGEERPVTEFTDVAALIGYLRSTPWYVPELDRHTMRPAFERLYGRPIRMIAHRFWVAAEKEE